MSSSTPWLKPRAMWRDCAKAEQSIDSPSLPSLFFFLLFFFLPLLLLLAEEEFPENGAHLPLMTSTKWHWRLSADRQGDSSRSSPISLAINALHSWTWPCRIKMRKWKMKNGIQSRDFSWPEGGFFIPWPGFSRDRERERDWSFSFSVLDIPKQSY